MQPKKIFVANWKMYLTYNESVTLLKQHGDDFKELASNAQIILCPSFDALSSISNIKPEGIHIGGQNTSKHESGAYTGQVSAQSLKEIGCSYCIIGHSEQRNALCKTDEAVAQKMARLLEQSIIPIICIGENEAEYAAGNTIKKIDQQLAPIIDIARKQPASRICIAYEPIWAIGTGRTPDTPTLMKIFKHLKVLFSSQLPNTHVIFLYGGSVGVDNAAELADIANIDGFLVGGASTDFQKFEKVVSLVCNKK